MDTPTPRPPNEVETPAAYLSAAESLPTSTAAVAAVAGKHDDEVLEALKRALDEAVERQLVHRRLLALQRERMTLYRQWRKKVKAQVHESEELGRCFPCDPSAASMEMMSLHKGRSRSVWASDDGASDPACAISSMDTAEIRNLLQSRGLKSAGQRSRVISRLASQVESIEWRNGLWRLAF